MQPILYDTRETAPSFAGSREKVNQKKVERRCVGGCREGDAAHESEWTAVGVPTFGRAGRAFGQRTANFLCGNFP